MKKNHNSPGNNRMVAALVILFAVLASLPWLVPHTGWLILFAFVPLFFAEKVATELRMRGFFWFYYGGFVLWNALTTFWVGGATVGGAVFAILANAIQMAAVFALLRLSRRRLGDNLLPYIFFAAAWMTFERLYFSAEISWPWLTLGGAFADTTKLVQWYSATGMLGGSLWALATNIAVFRLLCNILERNSTKSRTLLYVCVGLVAIPMVVSAIEYHRYEEKCEKKIDVVIGQPNFDPYQKFQSMTQSQQTDVLLDIFSTETEQRGPADLYVAPETFTSDISVRSIDGSPTVQALRSFASTCGGPDIMFGASAYEYSFTRHAPSLPARQIDGGWVQSRNSALLLPSGLQPQIRHKSKLVVGTELTPYPKFFLKVEKLVCSLTGQYPPLMGRCEPEGKARAFEMSDGTRIGCAVCYESIYGEYCADFVRDGAQVMSVITNDAWWGDTPGYRQHFNYSRLRAIELRRDIARCANTGISAFIDQRGEVVKSTGWWKREILRGTVSCNSEITPFVRYGDVCGRACEFLLALMALLIIALPFVRRG